MEDVIISMGSVGHRLVVTDTVIRVQHRDLNMPSGYEDNICFWQEDIPALKKAIKEYKKRHTS